MLASFAPRLPLKERTARLMLAIRQVSCRADMSEQASCKFGIRVCNAPKARKESQLETLLGRAIRRYGTGVCNPLVQLKGDGR